MAIVKATYTKSRAAAKAAIRYIQHRPGKDGSKVRRALIGHDGVLGRQQAYRMVDEAEKGTYFYRIAISPDPAKEDTHKDLHLWEITEQTMVRLEEQLQKPIAFVATEHNDHAPHRHVHVIAMVTGKLGKEDLQVLREAATAAAGLQRTARDVARERQAREREEAQWE
jgi:hypothetical protein